jgi:hypothetical protein
MIQRILVSYLEHRGLHRNIQEDDDYEADDGYEADDEFE